MNTIHFFHFIWEKQNLSTRPSNWELRRLQGTQERTTANRSTWGPPQRVSHYSGTAHYWQRKYGPSSPTLLIFNVGRKFKFKKYTCENICSHKISYVSAHRSTIPNSQNVEINQMPLNLWTDKQNNGIWFGRRKQWGTDTCYNMANPWQHYAK